MNAQANPDVLMPGCSRRPPAATLDGSDPTGRQTMPNIQVVDTTGALPAPIINMAVTFSIEEWAVIVEATANGSRTARDCEERVDGTLRILPPGDGRALVFSRPLENETYLSSLAVMATPRTTTDAID